MQVKCYAWVWKTERESKLEVTDVLWTLCLFPLFANIFMTFEIVILGLSNVELRFLYALNGLFNVKINWSSYQKLIDNSKAHWPIKWSIIHHMHLFLFRHVHTNPDIFETAYFFVLIREDGAINRLWRAGSKQFGFGDQIHWFFVGGAGRFVYKMYAVSKYPYSSGCSLSMRCFIRYKALHVTYEY